VQVDESAVTIAPLGGRHVNHFWRLLSTLEIPYITLLDLDVSRHGGGWGRIKYVNDQLKKFKPDQALPDTWIISDWNDESVLIRTHRFFKDSNDQQVDLLKVLERKDIFFSDPLDLDFSMILAFPTQYSALDKASPSLSTIKAVLGKSHHDPNQYSQEEMELFSTYHKRFKLGSKPAAHINALSQLSDEDLLANMPKSFERLADAVISKLEEWPE
jgi:hypothetical protein